MEPNWPEKRQSSFLYPLWDSAFERTGPSWNVVSICFNSSCNTSERLRTPQLSEALWLIVSQISQLGGAAMLRLLLASLFSCIAADEPGLELSAWLKFKKTKRSCCLLQNVASIACKTLKTFIYFHDILLNPHLISLYILYQPSFPSCWTVVSALRTASFCRPATVQRPGDRLDLHPRGEISGAGLQTHAAGDPGGLQRSTLGGSPTAPAGHRGDRFRAEGGGDAAENEQGPKGSRRAEDVWSLKLLGFGQCFVQMFFLLKLFFKTPELPFKQSQYVSVLQWFKTHHATHHSTITFCHFWLPSVIINGILWLI